MVDNLPLSKNIQIKLIVQLSNSSASIQHEVSAGRGELTVMLKKGGYIS